MTHPVVSRAAIEAFIDERLDAIRLRPLMYGGTPLGVETHIWGLLDIYLKFCVGDLPEDHYQAFRRTHTPRCPGPMPVHRWFTDPEYGAPEVKEPRAQPDHWAGVKIAEHFIAYKTYLKAKTQ